MERWSVPPSGYGSSSSHRATEKNRVRSRLSFFFFSILLIPSAIAAAGGGGVELFYFFPTRKRPFVRFRSFVHSFYFSSFSFVSIQLFLTSIKDLHDNATTWKKKRKKGLIAFTHRVMGAPSLFSPDSVGKKKFTRRNFTRPLVIFLSLIVS
jgi:hypothetical protein